MTSSSLAPRALLLATALGLVAAIPAVYFYNHFTCYSSSSTTTSGHPRARASGRSAALTANHTNMRPEIQRTLVRQ